MIQQRQVVVVGAGRVGSTLVRMMPTGWRVTAVDMSLEALDKLPDECCGNPIRKVCGDASSKLVLEDAGVELHSLVAVVTRSDKVNFEVGRLCRTAFGVEDIVVLLDEAEQLDEAQLRVRDIVPRDTATASLVFDRMSANFSRSQGLGIGLGDVMEITILNGSPAVDIPISELDPHRWLVAAIYRGENLVVPHGDTHLQADDRVILVGEPDVLAGVGPYLRGGEPVFPNQYGIDIGMAGGGSAADEAFWFTEATEALELVDVPVSSLDPDKNPGVSSVAGALADRKVGCLVLPPRAISPLARLGITGSKRKRLLLAAKVPILIARGTYPYKRVLVAIGGEQPINAVAGVAIDIARQCDASITALTVLPPSLSAGDAELEPLRRKPKRVAQFAALFNLHVEQIEDEGNPIERIRHHAREADLLVLGHSPRRRNSIFTPDVSLFLLHDAPCSTLFVPWNTAGR